MKSQKPRIRNIFRDHILHQVRFYVLKQPYFMNWVRSQEINNNTEIK